MSLWVKYGDTHATEVSTEGCKNVDGFIKAVMKELTPLLNAYAAAQISISLTAGGDAMRRGMRINEIPEIEKNDDENPLFISVIVPPLSVSRGVRPLQITPSLADDFRAPQIYYSHPTMHGNLVFTAGNEMDVDIPPNTYNNRLIINFRTKPFWSVEELSFEGTMKIVRQILENVKIPRLQYLKMQNTDVPFNPKSLTNICLLLHGIETFDIRKISISFQAHKVWSIVGTSGIGKTYTALSFLSQNFGLYFSCAEPGDLNFGSSDFNYFLQHLGKDGRNQKFVADAEKTENYSYVKRFICCMKLARLFVYNYLTQAKKSLRENLTAKEWLLVQLFPMQLPSYEDGSIVLPEADIFHQLTVVLRTLSTVDLEKMYQEEVRKSNWKRFPTFLDEAQMICTLYSGFFENDRPLYSAVCKSFIIGELLSVCAMGTGLSLQILDDLNSSNSFKSLTTTEKNCIITDSFKSAESVLAYISKFYQVPASLEYICHWLVGRPRIAASFIAHMYGKDWTHENFMDYILYYATDRGKDYSFSVKILDLIGGKRSLKDRDRISDMVSQLESALRGFVFSDDKAYITSNLDLFELGFGILEKQDRVVVFEPIILLAAKNALFGSVDVSPQALMTCFDKYKLPEMMTFFANNPSVQGLIFELFVPKVVLKLLQMDTETQRAAFGQVCWDRKLQLLENDKVLCMPACRRESHNYPLDKHLIVPKCLLLSLDTNRGADFAAALSDGNEKVGEITIQAKFALDFNQKEALQKSTYSVFKYKKGKFKIRILLSIPKKTKYNLSKVSGPEMNLVTLIIDPRNAHYFFNEKELELFGYLKETDLLKYFEQFYEQNLEEV